MATHNVYFSTEVSYVVTVEADSYEEAEEKAIAWDNEKGPNRTLCHQCSHVVEIGGDFEPRKEHSRVVE